MLVDYRLLYFAVLRVGYSDHSKAIQTLQLLTLCNDRGSAPVSGSVKVTQSETLASGDSGLPLGLKLSVSGNVSGRLDSGTACGTCSAF